MHAPIGTLPSADLLSRLRALVRRDQAAEAELLVHLGEVDARRLYLDEACSSMFRYCVRILHFAEGVAFKRIQVARAARRHPELLAAVRRGDLHITAASLLVPRLTRANVSELIRAAKHNTAEQVRELLADRSPRPDVPASVSRIPEVPTARPMEPRTRVVASETAATGTTRTPPPAPAPRPVAQRPEPLGQQRYCVRFTADRETWAALEELRALMRHQVPDGDLSKILARAIGVLLEQVRRQKLGADPGTDGPMPSSSARRSGGAQERSSRAIPAAIRRRVFRRDGGRCSYVSATGRRCGSRDFLEFHHRDPWARSRSHSVEGITLRCRAHNQHQAGRDFGTRHMARFRSTRRIHPEERDSDQVRSAGSAAEGTDRIHPGERDSDQVRSAGSDSSVPPERRQRSG